MIAPVEVVSMPPAVSQVQSVDEYRIVDCERVGGARRAGTRADETALIDRLAQRRGAGGVVEQHALR